jgi:hypothetical protein
MTASPLLKAGFPRLVRVGNPNRNEARGSVRQITVPGSL